MAPPLVGIIANPVSARDIRRVIANAASLQITDRANIVLRLLACLKACGIEQAVAMPENGGIRGHVRRGIERCKYEIFSIKPAYVPRVPFPTPELG
jgi:predicted polyphosphate/ATP-dependent NAD kinase